MVNNAHLRAIKASAGSGKTYQLALNYISLLGNRVNLSVLRSIVAMTFTNKAAAEMKYRIIKFLKEISFGTPEGHKLTETTGVTQENAQKWLDLILRNYDDFRVQTIDSFVFALMKAISWEIRRRPDVEPEFNISRLIQKSFDRLLLNLDNPNNRLSEIFEKALRCFLDIEQARGFNPEKHFKRRLEELFESIEKTDSKPVSIREDLSKSLEKLEKDMNDIATKIINICGASLTANAYKALSERKLDSAFFKKNHISELLKKNHKCSESIEELNQLYLELKDKAQEYLLLLSLARLAPYTDLLSVLREEMDRLCARDGIVMPGQWLKLITEHLSLDHIPLVYLTMGERLRHFLIDEFQDTSRIQWEVLYPLIQNAISEGGSLFYVGDPKQSIYIWRSAEPGIFREVLDSFRAYQPEVKVLDTNWRSGEKIVRSNNLIFSSLSDHSFVESLISDYFKDLGGNPVIQECAKEIANNFQDVVQNVPSGKSGTDEGYVELLPIPGSNTEERNEEIKKLIVEKIRCMSQNGLTFSDITVLVRTNREARIVFSWLWAEDIPAVTEHSLRIEKSPTVRALLNFMRFVNDPKDEISFVGFLKSDVAIESCEELKSLGNDWIFKAKTEGNESESLVTCFARRYREIYEYLFTRFLRTAGYETAYDIAREAIRYFKVRERFPEETSFVLRFLELINSMESSMGRFVSLSEFLSLWEEEGAEERLGIPEGVGAKLLGATDEESNAGAVRIMTIHGAKGLEFPAVIIPFTDWTLHSPPVVVLSDGRLARVSKPYPEEVTEKVVKERINTLTEAFNLFYVALTRARNHLVVMIPESPRSLGKMFKKLIDRLPGNDHSNPSHDSRVGAL